MRSTTPRTSAAGGKLSLLAQHGTLDEDVSDGTVLSSDGGNGINGNTVTFTKAGSSTALKHLLGDGSDITYTGSCCGLATGRTYSVIGIDDFKVQLGEKFTHTAVDIGQDTITFAGGHNFVTGDVIRFHEILGDVVGLGNGSRYEVYVVDEITIRIRAVGSGNEDTSSSVTSTTITANGHGFGNNTPVVYHAPQGKIITVPSSPTTNLTFVDNNGPVAHGFSNFDAVVYTQVGSNNLSGLTSGNVYWVVRIDADTLQLASTQCRALGDGEQNANCITNVNGMGVATNWVDRQVLTITATTGGVGFHTLTKVSTGPLNNLNDGEVYFVRNSTPNTFQLSSTLGGGAIGGLNTRSGTIRSGVSSTNITVGGSGHLFRYEGINLTGVNTVATGTFEYNASAGQWQPVAADAGAPSGTVFPGAPADGDKFTLTAGEFKIVHDLSTSASGGGIFAGLGSASSLGGATSGDSLVTAITGSSSGGGVDVANTTSTTRVNVITDLAINVGAVLNGGSVDIKTNSKINLASNANMTGLGGAAVGNPTANADGDNKSTLTVAAGAQVGAIGRPARCSRGLTATPTPTPKRTRPAFSVVAPTPRSPRSFSTRPRRSSTAPSPVAVTPTSTPSRSPRPTPTARCGCTAPSAPTAT